MTPAQVRAQIAAGDTAPVYLVESDDLPSRQEVAQAFMALVDEGLHAFNVATFFARDATTAGDRDALYTAILGAARTLPMMVAAAAGRGARRRGAADPAARPGRRRAGASRRSGGRGA